MRRPISSVSPSIAILTLSAVLMSACSKPADQAATTKPSGPPPVHVQVTPARTMELQRKVHITGSLAGVETATLSNRVSGRITRIYVDLGDRVKPGQKLLEIEPDRYKMAVDESQASLQQTLARLGLKEVPGEEFDVNQTAPVKKARSEFDLAKDKMDRATPLNQSKTINDFEYLAIVSAFKSAESTLESSRDEARALLAQARQSRVQVDMRSKDYSDSQIMAPEGLTPGGGGTFLKIESYAVADRKVSGGEYIREGSPLFTLVADGVLKFQARVPERYLSEVKKEATVSFKVEAYPTEEFTGKVTTIDPQVDPASRTFMIEALIDNAKYQNRLRPGSFVGGNVLTKKDSARVMVPLDAVTSFVGVMKIYKVDPADPSKAKAVDVTTGQQEAVAEDGRTQQWVEIVKGDVKASDKIIVAGQTKLVNGSPIIQGDQPAAPAATSQAAQ